MAVLSQRQHSLLSALLPIVTVMALFPFIDLLISALPMRIDEPRWRFAATGMLINAAPQVTVAVLLALGIAALLESRLVCRIAGIGAMIFAVLIGVAVLSFGLDALEVRRLVPENAKDGFDNASLKSLALVVLYGPVLLWAGWKGFAAGKRHAGDGKTTEGSAPLMVGQ